MKVPLVGALAAWSTTARIQGPTFTPRRSARSLIITYCLGVILKAAILVFAGTPKVFFFFFDRDFAMSWVLPSYDNRYTASVYIVHAFLSAEREGGSAEHAGTPTKPRSLGQKLITSRGCA